MKTLKLFFLLLFLLLPGRVMLAQEPGIKWIEVEGGSYIMNSGNGAKKINLKSYYISATEITFDQYDMYCKATGAEKPDDNGWGRGSRPVLKVSYDDTVGFCKWLSKISGTEIRLPNEAEWEYAANGGKKSKGYKFSGSNNWNEVSWSESNSDNKTQPVGTKKPNELGIYDMTGNLWEWCADLPDNSATKSGQGNKRVLKGNSFDNPASSHLEGALLLRGDSRHADIGFRIAKSK